MRATLRLYLVEDGHGNVLPVKQGDPIPVGSLVRIDLTAKDADEKETSGSGQVSFSFSDLSLVEVEGNHTFQRKLRVLTRGDLLCQARIDGVDSNTLRLDFK